MKQLSDQLQDCQANIEYLTSALAKTTSERNMFKADAHAKLVEHKLVAERYLEIRKDYEIIKKENIKLRDALKTLGQDLDELMIENK